ncbi:MAG: methyltransferase domain-containing protein [Lewinella sp.]|nr:methyltransferase domain-containing protein [Lewinella sp.]
MFAIIDPLAHKIELQVLYLKVKHSMAEVPTFNEKKKSQTIYRNLWGGDDLHVGLYDEPEMTPFEAARATTDRMLKLFPKINRSTRILILMSGFGTAARYIAESQNCKVDCLNDDEVQNAFNQAEIDKIELTKKIIITFGSVSYMPYAPDTFDYVIAQDSFSITDQKEVMFRAIHRVMKPEGRLVFSAIMVKDNLDEKVMARVHELPVDDLITLPQYEQDAKRGFFQQIYSIQRDQHLPTHFTKLAEILRANEKELVKQSSKAFVEERIKACEDFTALGNEGALGWGILLFQKLNG